MRPIIIALALLTAAARADDRLPSPYRDVPAERNGWTLLVEAASLVTDDDSVPLYPRTEHWDYPDRWRPSRPGVVRHLEVNAAALAAFEQAVARPVIEPPASWADDHWTGKHFRVIPKLRELARLKIQRAYLRRSQGDLGAALGDVDDLLRFVALRRAGAGDLVDYLVTSAIDGMALDALTVLLGPPLSLLGPAYCEPTTCWPVTPLGPAEEKTLASIERRLADESRALPAFRRALAGQLEGQRRTLHTPTFYEGPMPSRADIEQVLEYERDTALAALSAAEQPAWRRTIRPSADIPAPALLQRPPWPDVFWGTSNRDDRLAQLPDRDIAQRRLAATAIALRRYAARHDRLPRDLADLVADGLLPDVPVDPHDGQPLRYRPRQGLVYSVGRDRRDDQGQRSLDQIARLEFVIAAQPYRPTPPQRGDGPPAPGEEPWPPRHEQRGRSLF